MITNSTAPFRAHLLAHPAADMFPMMDRERFAEVKDDIAKHGIIEPIILHEGKILDGRNRYKAYCELTAEGRNIELPIELYTGNTPWCYVWSLNAQRRDLATNEQRAAIFLSMEDKIKAELKIIEEAVEAAAKAGRAKAANERPRNADRTLASVATNCGETGRDYQAEQERKTAAKLAEAAGVNRGAIERQRSLRNKNKELSRQVAMGEIRPSAAQRQIKKDEILNKVGSAVFSAEGPFDVVVIDPPWDMQKIERDVSPNQVAFDYPTMSIADLEVFWEKDMAQRVADDCHLFCWTTQKFLPAAINLVGLWGFKYVLTMVWHKPGGFQPFGLPQYNCEFVVYAHKGSPIFVDTKAFNCCFNAPRLEHSRKPDEFYDLIRRVTGGARIDVFSREARQGFAQFGNEIEKFKPYAMAA